MRSYTVWFEVPVPYMDDHTPYEVLSSVLLTALSEANLTPTRFVIEDVEEPPDGGLDIRSLMP